MGLHSQNYRNVQKTVTMEAIFDYLAYLCELPFQTFSGMSYTKIAPTPKVFGVICEARFRISNAFLGFLNKHI